VIGAWRQRRLVAQPRHRTDQRKQVGPKWRGARVIAVASGKHAAFLRGLGADEVIDYTQTAAGISRTVSRWCSTSARFLRTVRRGGMLAPVFLGFDGPSDAAERGITVSATQVRSNGAQLAELAQLLDAGTIRVAIDSAFPLAEAARLTCVPRGTYPGQDRTDSCCLNVD
jgi:NADPH:quinone reductase-like Zn-dependent oxidoreductase